MGKLVGGSSFISPNGFGSQALYLTSGVAGFTGNNNQWRWYVSDYGDTDQPGKVNASDFCINGAGCLGASGGIPIGGIIMWSGSVANIPSGWKLCNGNNGTPNLSGRFIVGAGVTAPYTPNQIGGTRDAVIVSHKHTFLTDDNGIGGADAAAIGISGITYLNGGGAQGGGSLYQLQTSLPRSVDGWGQSITLTGTGNALETGVDKNIPPFYALAFIMRTL
ncbi:hypothetical protein EXS61_01410 [Candidatus Parcubacteria bacterium]|nr:hypothetical protein [Candidatus Parcubacteria bacterium]